MSKKFTGITSAGSAIPVYDKDAHSALEQKLDTSAFSSVSGEFATVDDVVAAVSGKADTSAIPSLDGYATEEWVGEQGYLTEVPESAVSGFATHEEVESATSGKADASGVVDYNNKPSANAISADDHTLYIKNEYGAGGEVLANNSGFYVHATNSNYGFIAGATPYSVHTNAPFTLLHYGGISSLTNPTAPANGTVVEAGWNVHGLTTKDTKQNTSAGVTTTSGVYQINENKTHYLSAKQDISGMSAYQPVGDYYSATNPSGFIVADDITGKMDASAMTAYQPVGDYQSAGDYLSASESANFYPMTGNPSGFLTEHQSLDGLMQTSGLEYDGDKISGYMGSAFAGGGEVPEDVMVESAIGYNAAGEISGYGNSAIAQYGAEKQWLVHDDTLVHAANSAQYALGVNLSAVAQLLGVSGPLLNQETFAGYWNGYPEYQQIQEFVFTSNTGSNSSLPAEVYRASAVESRRRIDVSNSFIVYGNSWITLPLQWYLASNRCGGFMIYDNGIYYRGTDSAPTQCTAYICYRYRKQ